MIRIETTAEFDAEGRFTLQGLTQVPVTPGTHRVTVVVSDVETIDEATPPPMEDTEDPMLKRINGVLVWTGQLLEDPEETRRRLDEEQTDRYLHGPWE